jgi:aminoglycoside phosphotransferase (APT) family kinase protein
MAAPEGMRLRRTSRDPEVMRLRLQEWLRGVLGGDCEPVVSELEGTEANGMSSDTTLFRAQWTDGDGPHDERLVARIAPDPHDIPVFPAYDMKGQFEVIRLAGELAGVPVPRPWWCETDPAPIGAPFFVMSRVDGLVPPDVMPYTFGDNWLHDATPQQQRTLQDSTIDAIAALHRIDDAPGRFAFLERAETRGSYLRRHVDHTRAWYDMVAGSGAASPAVERGFDWLDRHWPAHESTPVLSWGDSRIGNVMYADFRPAALLDWEMAGLGPAELDIGWITYAHVVFQDLAAQLGAPGMPGFMTVDDVATRYESVSGHTPRNLPFYMAYAALQWGVVFLRTGQRSAHFGEREMPADTEDLIMNRAHVESMLTDRF